jgi:hypothetical protein
MQGAGPSVTVLLTVLLTQKHVEKRGRDSMEIVEKTLELIQQWGEAFLPHQEAVPLFPACYHKMRKKGAC